jgi:hypothetical protein
MTQIDSSKFLDKYPICVSFLAGGVLRASVEDGWQFAEMSVRGKEILHRKKMGLR